MLCSIRQEYNHVRVINVKNALSTINHERCIVSVWEGDYQKGNTCTAWLCGW